MYATRSMYMLHKKGRPSDIQNLTLLINCEILFAGIISCVTMFQIFNAINRNHFKAQLNVLIDLKEKSVWEQIL